MEEFSFQAVSLIVIACLLGGVLIGYLIGRFVGKNDSARHSKATAQAIQAHDDYRQEVRTHFEHSAHIMSRMVDDYREMYQHLSSGAEQLTDSQPMRVVAPPAPEAITDQANAAVDADAQKTPDQASHPAPTPPTATDQVDTPASGEPGADPAQDKPSVDTDPPKPGAAAGAGNAEDDKARARRLSGNQA